MSDRRQYPSQVKMDTSIHIAKPPSNPRWLGSCQPNGRIYINPSQGAESFLDTAIHELLHRYFPWLSEDMVTLVANDMRIDLWSLGYRRYSDEMIKAASGRLQRKRRKIIE